MTDTLTTSIIPQKDYSKLITLLLDTGEKDFQTRLEKALEATGFKDSVMDEADFVERLHDHLKKTQPNAWHQLLVYQIMFWNVSREGLNGTTGKEVDEKETMIKSYNNIVELMEKLQKKIKELQELLYRSEELATKGKAAIAMTPEQRLKRNR